MKKNYWSKYYSKSKKELSFPAEGVIRIFKGTFPKLRIKFKKKHKILDVGFGDGRHLNFLKHLGLKVYGVEVAQNIIDKLKEKNSNLYYGFASNLPFRNDYFNLLLSWNSCYYMGKNKNNLDFNKVILEFKRVLKQNGYLILSVPTQKNFIFKKSVKINSKYRKVSSDYFGLRNGEIMRCYNYKSELRNDFQKYFKNFCFSTIDIDCFGLAYHWIVMVAQKK